MTGLRLGRRAAAAAGIGLVVAAGAANAQLMIVGNDEKPAFQPDGKVVTQAPGHDTLSIIDMAKPAALRIVATIPLDNSIAGPPTNLAITPARDIALVASAMKGEAKEGGYATVADNRLFVVDLKANPPVAVATVTLGKQPSGLAISPDGTLALVCNRADGTVSVLAISGKDVKVTGTVSIGTDKDSVSAVAIAPDGKRALVLKAAAGKVAVLAIDGGKVTYDQKDDLPANNYPYNVAISPNGKIALVANTGNGGSSDGNADTVSVIDMEAKPIRVIDHVTVGDAPEGLAISPKGDLAVTIEARGSNRPPGTWFRQDGGAVGILKIDGKKVTNVGTATVGALPESVTFSADSSHLYVGNFIDQDLSVFEVDGVKLTDKGRFKLPGHPASMRGGPQ